MRVSLLQPHITRGELEHNAAAVQRLVDRARGDLLVLPEYALTGSLVLDAGADVHAWARQSAQIKARLGVPAGKYLLLNALVETDDGQYNACELLPTGERYCKLFPDPTEQEAGIRPGAEPKVFTLCDRRFQVLICYDLAHAGQIPTPGLDFILFIYHFTAENFARVIAEVKQLSKERQRPVLVSSLVSDRNHGFSSYVEEDLVVSLSSQEDILEVEIR